MSQVDRPGERSNWLDAGCEPAIGELFDKQFGPFQVGDNHHRSTAVVGLPHAVLCFGRAETCQFHDGPCDKHKFLVDSAM